MEHRYTLSFPGGVIATREFESNFAIDEIARILLKDAMRTKFNKTQDETFNGACELMNCDTKEKWNVTATMCMSEPRPMVLNVNLNEILQPEVIFYGGSFDPFHRGHALVVDRLLKEMPTCKKVFLCVTPNKFKHSAMFGLQYRIDLIERWIQYNNKYINASNRVGLARTNLDSLFATLIELRPLFADVCTNTKVAVVIGDDCLHTIQSWIGFDNKFVSGEYDFIIVQRDMSYDQICEHIPKFKSARVNIMQHNFESMRSCNKVNSTSLRNEIDMQMYNKLLQK